MINLSSDEKGTEEVKKYERNRKRGKLLRNLWLVTVLILFALFLLVIPIVQGTSTQISAYILVFVLSLAFLLGILAALEE